MTSNKSYNEAKEIFAKYSVDTEKAINKALAMPISMQCWQGDDVSGFERDTALSGGLAVTGNFKGAPRNVDELREDAEAAFKMIPGKMRFNLHAIYADYGGKIPPRNEITPALFSSWADWAKALKIGLDFNPTFFSHPLAADGFTLSSQNQKTRKFWVEHAIACRKIGEFFGKKLGTACVTNIWIPDGMKDTPANRMRYRKTLEKSLDEILSVKISPKYNLDAVEGKLFGLGSESFVVGSHEFYMGYSITRKTLLCLDTGHFHPTETITDKISTFMMFMPQILLHVSRGVRWDSDHVVSFSDDTKAAFLEVVRGKFENRTHVALDFCDASINRVAAWAIGARNARKAALNAYLEPFALLDKYEREGDFTSRLALMEEAKTLPLGAVWAELCRRANTPVSIIDEVKSYEKKVLGKRI